MASPRIWLEVLALMKALFEAITASANLYETYKKYTRDKDTLQEASRVSSAFSTYSEEEVKAILERLKGCSDRFIKQGGGKDRAMCMCSVLNEVKEGNGGVLPEIDDWARFYATLGCGKYR